MTLPVVNISASRMPRKLIRKYMPDEAKLKENRHLGWLGKHLHEPNLWHLTRKSVSRAFLVGLFCAFLPIPAQMLVAAVLALFVRSNLPISVGLVWITNPITMPPIFYFAFVVGAWIMDLPSQDMAFEFSVDWLSSGLSHIWQPLLLGSVICGIVAGILGYLLMQAFWVWQVNRSWKRRRRNGNGE